MYYHSMDQINCNIKQMNEIDYVNQSFQATEITKIAQGIQGEICK